jgi:hypothetical protein
LTEALLEVVWAMRAYRHIRLKLFLRPDQIEDDALRFVELPKLRTGALRLTWKTEDLYGLLYTRLALTPETECLDAFKILLQDKNINLPDKDAILTRRWSLVSDRDQQKVVMDALAGRYMGQGNYDYKKGSTYNWPITHLGDAFFEVTPRSFLGLMTAAAQHGGASENRVITPDGIRHGLRAASKTRVDQLHQKFPWIKGVLKPLSGLLLPQTEDKVIDVWKEAKTVEQLVCDAKQQNYLPPFSSTTSNSEHDLCVALERIGVMSRRNDDRIDMPDLFRVAAKLLKKGNITPSS